MLKPLDRTRRDGPLYAGSEKTLRDFIAPHHLLLRIDASLDLAAFCQALDAKYALRGRPAVHPEILLRALLLGAIYAVPANREICRHLQENLAWRYFCHLTLEDPVFDHSTISHFLDRIGAAGVREVFERLDAFLQEAGLFSASAYLDSTLLAANVRTQTLEPRDAAAAAVPPLVEEEGVWTMREIAPGTAPEPAQLRRRRFQDEAGRLPLPRHDRDCRWRTIRGTTTLGYKEHVIAERAGFVRAYGTTGADVADVDGARPLLPRLATRPARLTADTGYRKGHFRFELDKLGITSYIPLDPKQRPAGPPGFVDHQDHLICPAGKRLSVAGLPDADESVRYAARTSDCQACALRTSCLAPKATYKQLWLARYRFTFARAQRRNQTVRYAREMRRRKTIIEGVFAHLDRLGGVRARYRRLERVDCQTGIAVIAHNILKALTKRRFWRRAAAALLPPVPDRRPALTMLLLAIP